MLCCVCKGPPATAHPTQNVGEAPQERRRVTPRALRLAIEATAVPHAQTQYDDRGPGV